LTFTLPSPTGVNRTPESSPERGPPIASTLSPRRGDGSASLRCMSANTAAPCDKRSSCPGVAEPHVASRLKSRAALAMTSDDTDSASDTRDDATSCTTDPAVKQRSARA
jgi:hypothetical protein